MTKRILGTLFFGLFFTAGFFAVGLLIHQLPKAISSEQWPSVDGVVTESSLRQGRKRRRSHRLRYQYVVDGQPIEGKQVAFMGRVFASSARRRHAAYPVGRKVTVYYHPQQPEVAVLEPGVNLLSFTGLGVIATVFVVIGALGLRVTFRRT